MANDEIEQMLLQRLEELDTDQTYFEVEILPLHFPNEMQGNRCLQDYVEARAQNEL